MRQNPPTHHLPDGNFTERSKLRSVEGTSYKSAFARRFLAGKSSETIGADYLRRIQLRGAGGFGSAPWNKKNYSPLAEPFTDGDVWLGSVPESTHPHPQIGFTRIIRGFRHFTQSQFPDKSRCHSRSLLSCMNLYSATDLSKPLICLYSHSITFLLTCSTNASDGPSSSSSIL